MNENFELIKINRWFVAKQLIISDSKPKFMVFHHRNKLNPIVLPPIRINITSTKRLNSFNFLGGVLDVFLKLK